MKQDLLRELTLHLDEHWGFSGELTALSGGLNHQNFLLDTGSEHYFLKCYSQNTSSTQLSMEAQALEILNGGKALEFPCLKATMDGQTRVPWKHHVLSCFSHLQGTRRYSLLEIPTSARDWYSVGNVLAIIHRELRQSHPLNDRQLAEASRSRLRQYFDDGIEICGLGAKTCARLRMSILAALSTLEKLRCPYQRIHGDFQVSSLLYQGQEICAVCDFEYSGWEYRAFELAMTHSILRTVGKLEGQSPAELFAALINGYNQAGELLISEAELALISGALSDLALMLNLCWAQAKLASQNPNPSIEQLARATRDLLVAG